MSSSTVRAFIIDDDPRFDTAPAESFGRRVFLNPSPSPFNALEFMRETRRLLVEQGYDPDRDFITMSGKAIKQSLFIGAVCSEWAPVQLLLFHAPTNTYQVKTVCREYATDVG